MLQLVTQLWPLPETRNSCGINLACTWILTIYRSEQFTITFFFIFRGPIFWEIDSLRAWQFEGPTVRGSNSPRVRKTNDQKSEHVDPWTVDTSPYRAAWSKLLRLRPIVQTYLKNFVKSLQVIILRFESALVSLSNCWLAASLNAWVHS